MPDNTLRPSAAVVLTMVVLVLIAVVAWYSGSVKTFTGAPPSPPPPAPVEEELFAPKLWNLVFTGVPDHECVTYTISGGDPDEKCELNDRIVIPAIRGTDSVTVTFPSGKEEIYTAPAQGTELRIVWPD